MERHRLPGAVHGHGGRRRRLQRVRGPPLVAARPIIRHLREAHGPRYRRLRGREPRLPDRLFERRPGLQGLGSEHRLCGRHERRGAAGGRDDRAVESAGPQPGPAPAGLYRSAVDLARPARPTDVHRHHPEHQRAVRRLVPSHQDRLRSRHRLALAGRERGRVRAARMTSAASPKEDLMTTATRTHSSPADDGAAERPAGAHTDHVAHLSREQRAARGKATRAAVPRSSHAGWEPAPDRRDPVDVLEDQALTRVAELVPIRYGRMLVSPFTFYRGGAALMAADLAGTPRTDLRVQLCGDAHLSNFGAFAAPDRRLIFSVNDFDETLPGPFEWDVKRLVASFAVAGRDRGFEAKARATVELAVSRAYREAMREFAGMRALDIWYARIDVENVAREWVAQASVKQRKRFEGNLAKAQ